MATLAFLIGGVAISALPPLNGFASEFLIYKGLFHVQVTPVWARVALAGVAGVALMLGMRIAMRRQLEPLSARARWALVAMLAVVGVGGYLVYALATRVLA